jgi:glycosyltransferase involved in cell wall biosynthesis
VKNKIVYIGPFSFPNGGAGARRILGNAMALRDAGYEVVIASGQVPREGVESPHYDTYEGFQVVSLGERTAEKYPRILKHLAYINMGKKSVAWLESLSEKPKAVILYSGYTPYMMRLIPWCERNGVEFIFDAVEWYDPKTPWHWFVSPYHWNTELALRYFARKTQGAITISSYLERHYRKCGAKTVLVPPTLDTEAIEPSLETDNEVLTLAYTGTPGHKDLFNEYLEAVLRLGEEGEKIRFVFAGVSKEMLEQFEAIRKRGIDSSSLPQTLRCRGIVSQNEAIRLVGNADFTILLRKPQRYAQAGFPTKVVESMAMGTPVICNLTSDLERYVQDGQNGIVCEGYDATALYKALKRVLRMKKREKRQMRKAARDMATEVFDYRRYRDMLRNFIEKIR